MRLLVSIVTYRPDLELLAASFRSLTEALARSRSLLETWRVVVVDNDPQEAVAELCLTFGFEWCPSGRNLGYGRGHNRVVGETDLRLILNPDVLLSGEGLKEAVGFLLRSPDVGIVVPSIAAREGRRTPLCRRYPSVLVFALRGLAPGWLKAFFQKRLSSYEMRDVDWSRVQRVPCVASGCCFLIREAVWRRLGGFDPGYFLYFEDFDLFLRAQKITEIIYLPTFRIIHYGGGAARKGWQHWFWFVRSGWRFFQRHGWRWV